MPSTSFFRQDMPVSSPNHEPPDREGYEHSLPAQQGSLTLCWFPGFHIENEKRRASVGQSVVRDRGISRCRDSTLGAGRPVSG